MRGSAERAAKKGAPLPSVQDAKRRLGLGLDPSQPDVSVSEWLDMWLATKRRTKRESTCRGYEMHIRTWLKPQLGHLPLERLNAGHVEDLFSSIQRINAELAAQRAAGIAPMEIMGDARGQSRACGPTTQLRIFATLRAALNAAVRQRKITWNPCDGVELEHPDTAERQRWTPVEAARFIAFVADDEMGLMFRVAVLRAPRRAELCGFRWADSVLEKPYPDPQTGLGAHGRAAWCGAAHHPTRREARRIEGQDEARAAQGLPGSRDGGAAAPASQGSAQAAANSGRGMAGQ
jgi:hypothetical protein